MWVAVPKAQSTLQSFYIRKLQHFLFYCCIQYFDSISVKKKKILYIRLLEFDLIIFFALYFSLTFPLNYSSK